MLAKLMAGSQQMDRCTINHKPRIAVKKQQKQTQDPYYKYISEI